MRVAHKRGAQFCSQSSVAFAKLWLALLGKIGMDKAFFLITIVIFLGILLYFLPLVCRP
jgi:hypothetical protein